ncbi:MAG: YdcF family protein [Anaerolineales bacterium]|nr:YdcF family protein [Anaerolineales bacterium]
MTIKRLLKILRRTFFALAIVGAVGVTLPRIVTSVYSIHKIYQAEDAPPKRLAIVFGAGLRRDGTPTAILRDRVETAADLYFAGKVEKLLMSGDNRFAEYNEPESMRQYALSLGVPDEAIAMDYAGRRTYDTCYRAKEIFKVDDILLVTQKFHLPRALFLCNALGMKATGVEANTRRFWSVSMLIWNTRELLATAGAFLDLFVTRPQPVLGEPIPLFVD